MSFLLTHQAQADRWSHMVSVLAVQETKQSYKALSSEHFELTCLILMTFLQVISWFYYWRAAWNVVERKLAFPNEPLPDPAMLRKDFDTCVISGKIKCINRGIIQQSVN